MNSRKVKSTRKIRFDKVCLYFAKSTQLDRDFQSVGYTFMQGVLEINLIHTK